MALALKNRVQETGTANTTVSFTLSGAVQSFQSFTSVGNGNTTYYTATDASGNWEVGIGTYSTTGPTLTRTTILSSSNAGSAVTFSGTVNVWVDYPSEKSVNLDASGNVSALGTVSSGTWNGSTVGVAYGGTGVTSSSGASSVVLRDSNQNVTANNYFPGYTAVTAAAGTTVLTAASSFYQRLSGSTTQTFQLPVATTMPNGAAFSFDNDSSGTLTIVDNASATVDTIPAGGYGYIFLEDNATSAGSWGKYAFLPGSYNFSTSSADFGNATISNAVWNGTTIDSGYGGTGLTTFTAANNALYSTSASALAAGTLPVAAGGTGATTLTQNGVVYGNGTSAAGITAAGTTGQVLIATTSGAPSWGSVPTTAAVTSITFGTTGLTPATATTGAVTVAGTLAVANGGTGVTTSTGSGSTVLSTSPTLVTPLLGTPTSGTLTNCTGYTYANLSGTVPTWNQNTSGTAAGLSATLVATSGGTGQSTVTTGDLLYGSATNTWSKLADVATGNVLTSGGVGVAPAWGKVALASAVSGTLSVANGGTGQTSYTNGQILIGNTTGNTLALGTITAGTGISVTNGAGSITIASTVTGTVTGVTATAPVVSSGGTAPVISMAAATSLANGYLTSTDWSTFNGKYSVGGALGTPSSGTLTNCTFPTLNQNTTGSSGSCTGNAATATTATNLSGGTVAATTITATGNITAYFSDERLKTNLGNIPNALAKVQTLDGFYYEPNETAQALGYEVKREVGVSAQQVQAILPEIIAPAPIDNQYLTVDYERLVPLLIEAIKELKAEVDELKKAK